VGGRSRKASSYPFPANGYKVVLDKNNREQLFLIDPELEAVWKKHSILANPPLLPKRLHLAQ
jgi:hypothetical protein